MKLGLALDTLKDVISELTESGELLASEEIQRSRMKVCGMCPYFTGSRCEKSGCFMGVKVKFVASKCPADYWNEKIIEEALTGEMTPPIPRSCCGG